MKRHPVWSFIVLGLLVWLVIAAVVTLRSPQRQTPTAATPTTTIQQGSDQEYGQDCGNYSPTKDELTWFYSADANGPAGTPNLLGASGASGAYGTVGTAQGQVSCAPAWVAPLKTLHQLEVAWYGHTCNDYSPTPSDLHYFFFNYAHVFTCDQGSK